MSEVGYKETAVYGFKLIGYLACVLIAAGVITGIGSLVSSAQPLMAFIGGLFGLLGVLTFFAGIFSLLYKVIVDATDREE